MANLRKENIAKEIVSSNLDLGIDYAEIPLDKFIIDDALREIPVVKTLFAIVETGIAVNNIFFVKKFVVFLRAFHSGQIDHAKLEEFKKEFENNPEYREKITDQVLILVDGLNSTKKSEVLAHIFLAHIERKYNWEHFVALSNCLEKLQEISYPFLKILSEKNFSINSGSGVAEIEKALKAGVNFGHKDGEALLMAAGVAHREGTLFAVTSFGKDLYNYGISKMATSD